MPENIAENQLSPPLYDCIRLQYGLSIGLGRGFRTISYALQFAEHLLFRPPLCKETGSSGWLIMISCCNQILLLLLLLLLLFGTDDLVWREDADGVLLLDEVLTLIAGS